MLTRWIRYIFWHPFELSCRKYPIVPLRATVMQAVDGVACIRIDNSITHAISYIGGGYDYSVCYLIDETLLIDTGFPWARRALKKKLVELKADKTLRDVVNTHYHEDHIGNNDLIVELTEAKILAHKLAVPEIRFPEELPWYRQFMFGPITSAEVQPIPDRIYTNRFEFEVHHLAGHSQDHICLFEPRKRWLFSGDLYIAADLDSQLRDANGPEWIRSLEKAISLKPKYLFDAHGVILSDEESVNQLLVRKRDFLIELQKRIVAEAQKAQSVREITRKVFYCHNLVDHLSFSDGWLSLLTGSNFSRSNLVKSFLRECNSLSAKR